jgi:hypothetical protein
MRMVIFLENFQKPRTRSSSILKILISELWFWNSENFQKTGIEGSFILNFSIKNLKLKVLIKIKEPQNTCKYYKLLADWYTVTWKLWDFYHSTSIGAGSPKVLKMTLSYYIKDKFFLNSANNNLTNLLIFHNCVELVQKFYAYVSPQSMYEGR